MDEFDYARYENLKLDITVFEDLLLLNRALVDYLNRNKEYMLKGFSYNEQCLNNLLDNPKYDKRLIMAEFYFMDCWYLRIDDCIDKKEFRQVKKYEKIMGTQLCEFIEEYFETKRYEYQVRFVVKKQSPGIVVKISIYAKKEADK